MLFTFLFFNFFADPRLAIGLQEVGHGRCHAVGGQERICRLQDVDGVDIVVVWVGCMVDCTDGKQQAIELVCDRGLDCVRYSSNLLTTPDA